MKHRRSILILFATVLGAWPALCGAAPPEPFAGTITRIVDVDTYWITKSGGKETVKVRVRWIDGPEKKQAYGKEAIEFVNKWLLNANVTVSPTGKKTYDRIEASVAWNLGEPPWALGTQLDVDVAKMLVANGYAMCDPRFNPPQELKDAELEAAKKGRGQFRDWLPPMPPWTWRAQQKALK